MTWDPHCNFCCCKCFLLVLPQTNSNPGRLIVEVSSSHTDTRHSVEPFWTSDRPLGRDLYPTAHSTQHDTDIHAPGRIRTRNPSKRTVADPLLRPCDHRDRRYCKLVMLLYLLIYSSLNCKHLHTKLLSEFIYWLSRLTRNDLLLSRLDLLLSCVQRVLMEFLLCY